MNNNNNQRKENLWTRFNPNLHSRKVKVERENTVKNTQFTYDQGRIWTQSLTSGKNWDHKNHVLS